MVSIIEVAMCDMLGGPDLEINMELCDNINKDPWIAKKVVKAVEKRMRRGLLKPWRKIRYLALGVLEVMVTCCDDFIHDRIAATSILREMVRIAKENRESQAREKVLFLLDSWQEAFGGPCGRYPQYFRAYDELQRAGIDFSRRSDTSYSIFAEPQTHLIAASQCGIEVPAEMLNVISPKDGKATKGEMKMERVEQCHAAEVQVGQVVDATSSTKVNATSNIDIFKDSDDSAKVVGYNLYLAEIIKLMMYGAIRFASNGSFLEAAMKIMQSLPTTDVPLYVKDVLLTMRRLLQDPEVYNMDILSRLIEYVLISANNIHGEIAASMMETVGAEQMMRVVVFNSSGRSKNVTFNMLACILRIAPEVAISVIRKSFFREELDFDQKTFLLELLEFVIQKTGSEDIVDDAVSILMESCLCCCDSCKAGVPDHILIPIKIIGMMATELRGLDQNANLEMLLASMLMHMGHPSEEITSSLITTIRAMNGALGKKALLIYFMLDLLDIGSPKKMKVWKIYNAVFHNGENQVEQFED